MTVDDSKPGARPANRLAAHRLIGLAGLAGIICAIILYMATVRSGQTTGTGPVDRSTPEAPVLEMGEEGAIQTVRAILSLEVDPSLDVPDDEILAERMTFAEYDGLTQVPSSGPFGSHSHIPDIGDAEVWVVAFRTDYPLESSPFVLGPMPSPGEEDYYDSDLGHAMFHDPETQETTGYVVFDVYSGYEYVRAVTGPYDRAPDIFDSLAKRRGELGRPK